MKAYTFAVCHTTKVYRELTVQAESDDEAEEKAVQEAERMEDFDRYGPDEEEYTIDQTLVVEEL